MDVTKENTFVDEKDRDSDDSIPLADDDHSSIPLADDDPSAIIDEDDEMSNGQTDAEKREDRWRSGDCESLDSIPSMFSDHFGFPEGSQGSGPSSLIAGTASHISEQMHRLCLDPDFSPDEAEEKARLISQVLELQNTLDDLTSRVDAVKEENLKLRSENSVLGQYIENLMQASTVFQSVSPKAGRKQSHKQTVSGAGHLGNVIRSTARAVRGTSSATPSPSSSTSTPTMATTSSSSSGSPAASKASAF